MAQNADDSKNMSSVVLHTSGAEVPGSNPSSPNVENLRVDRETYL